MAIYLGFIFLMILQSVILGLCNRENAGIEKVEKNNKLYTGVMAIEFVCLSGLRNITVGSDTKAYMDFFHQIDKYYCWEDMIPYMAHGLIGKESWFEPLFVLFMKTMHVLTDNVQICLFVIAVIVLVPMALFVYRNSRNISLSMMIYMCLFFQCFGITAIRQAIALSIVVYIGYYYVKNREVWKYFVCLIIAFYFHHSAIIMLPFYFLYQLRLSKKMRIAYCGVFLGIFILKNQIILFADRLVGVGYTTYIGQKPSNMMIIMMMLTLFCLWKYDKLVEIRSENIGVLNAVFVGTLVLPFSQVNSTYMRLSYFYYMFLMILIPEILLLFPKKWKNIFTVCAYAGMIALFARHGLQYSFFWQA